MTTQSTYGFVGLGNMGGPMAAHLARSGTELVVFDKAGTAARLPAGARAAFSAADVAATAETIFLSLPDGAVVLDVLAEICTAPGRVARTVIDLSTVGVGAARSAFEHARSAGMTYVDAPVSGGRSGAINATISIMWAGPAELLELHRHTLDAMAKHLFHVGSEAGQGQALKLLNNFLSATATAATGEAVVFGLSQGLDMKMILDVVNVSTGRSRASEDKYVNRVLSGTFDSGFATHLMAKDVRLYSEAAGAAGTPHDIGATVAALWDAVEVRMPDSDHTEVFAFLRDGGGPDEERLPL
jgi:3-hydroxyisobutyrate dehydrogenase-like beta-hydroxyacid dehydrogenase